MKALFAIFSFILLLSASSLIVIYKSTGDDILGFFRTGDNSFIEAYSPVEKSHLSDVRHLIFGLLGLCILSAVFAAGLGALLYLKGELSQGLLIAGITSAVCGVLLSAMLLFFNSAFLSFHYAAFSNMNWLLPADSLLIRQYPLGFFYNATRDIIIIEILLSAVLFFGSKASKIKTHIKSRKVQNA